MNKKLKLLKTLWPYVQQNVAKLWGAVILSLFLVALKVYQAYLVKPIFDKGLSSEGSLEESLKFAGILMAVMLINFPCRFFHFYWIRYIVDQATCSIQTKMFKKIQDLPMVYFQRNKQGDLISKLINDTQIFGQGLRAVMDGWREPLTAIGFLSLAFYRDWALTLIILLVAPLFLIIFGKTGKKVKAYQTKVQEEQAELAHVMSEGIVGQKITKAFNLQDYVSERFQRIQNKYFHFLMKTTWLEEFAHPLVELVGGLAFSGIIIFAHYRIKSGAMTTGDFVSFVTALALFMDPIRKLSQANIKLSQAGAAGDRIFALLNLENEKGGEVPKESFTDSIKVHNLTFSYGEGEVLKNFSMEIKKGQKVALVGLSGSGKSTLVNLLLGLYPLTEGMITIDGQDISKLQLQDLRKFFGLVSQDIFLFNDTIKENLVVGADVTPQSISKALKVAYADEFINKLPGQLETTIGDRGMRLSGGQQQRITIARAFLKDCPILLFDEATSALDNESEKIVQRALDELSKDKTVLAIAHRLSTIQNFDQIFVLHEGRLVEQGTHGELMTRSGEYQKLYELSLS